MRVTCNIFKIDAPASRAWVARHSRSHGSQAWYRDARSTVGKMFCSAFRRCVRFGCSCRDGRSIDLGTGPNFGRVDGRRTKDGQCNFAHLQKFLRAGNRRSEDMVRECCASPPWRTLRYDAISSYGFTAPPGRVFFFFARESTRQASTRKEKTSAPPSPRGPQRATDWPGSQHRAETSTPSSPEPLKTVRPQSKRPPKTACRQKRESHLIYEWMEENPTQ